MIFVDLVKSLSDNGIAIDFFRHKRFFFSHMTELDKSVIGSVSCRLRSDVGLYFSARE